VAHAVILATWEAEIRKDCGSKPAWAKSFQDPVLKISNTKQDWWSDSRGRVPAKHT
jgi:hypothetical protein